MGRGLGWHEGDVRLLAEAALPAVNEPQLAQSIADTHRVVRTPTAQGAEILEHVMFGGAVVNR